MPAIDPKSLPANLQPGAPSRNLTPQEMQTAVRNIRSPGMLGRPPAGFVEEAPPQMDTMPDPRLMQASNVPGRIDRQYAKGGGVKGYASGGKTGSASSRADGCAQRGHTKGKMR